MDHTIRMREALEQSGQSQSDVAQRLGVSQSTVSQWLQGKRRPDKPTLQQFATAVGVTAVWLDYGAGDGPAPDLAAERETYRSDVRWTFTPERPDGQRDFGNANIFSFKPTISTFVREVLQNVGDAAIGGQAKAQFTFRRLRGADLETFLDAVGWPDFEPHLEASVSSGQQVGSSLEYGLRAVRGRDVLILEISDYGTAGLTGPEVGRGNFAALCRNNLDSSKPSGRAGGSYGLGKAVLWRMSGLSTVLFLSNLSEPDGETGNQQGRFIGRSELVWHECDDEQTFAGPGWLGAIDPAMPQRPISYWENSTLATDLRFSRGPEAGTSIIVLCFRDPSSDEDQSSQELSAAIEKAAAQYFWPALSRGNLAVSVQVAEGSAVHRSADVDVNTTRPQLADMLYKFYNDETVDRLLEPGDVVAISVPLDVPECIAPEEEHPAFTHMAQVLVRRANADDDSESSGQAQYYRGPGMIIHESDLSRVLVGAQPFHVAVLCGLAAGNSIDDERAERFLRAAEPPAHNTWEITEKVQREYTRGGGAAIRRFETGVRQAVREILVPAVDNPPNGPRDLAALFKLGEPVRPERAPRLIVDSAVIDDDGAWKIEATIRVASPAARVVGRPVVLFRGETGGGSRVRWRLEQIKDCTIEDDKVVVAPGKRTARFRGVTDPSSHPVPVSGAAISVEFRAVREDATS